MAAQALAGLGGQLFQRLGHGQGVEDIVLEPGAQRDVPALPKLRDGAGEEGTLEILRNLKAEDPARTHRQVHGAGEVHVELDGVAHGGHGDDQPVVVLIVIKNRLDQQIEPVGHQNFFD